MFSVSNILMLAFMIEMRRTHLQYIFGVMVVCYWHVSVAPHDDRAFPAEIICAIVD